ncbi:16S rRNA (cytidine(1402)-2'-O)-methyltransferase [bacterium]|nr:16S rRNA (cytidine(1402)-2'-O)-methyltransferase [bacterium]
MDAKGILYLIGTPIGNLADVTLRALETLRACDVIYCEDTRVSRRLLSHHGISKPTSSFHEYSDARVVERIRRDLEAGKKVGYVTDAGMPGVSDPGPQLVAMCMAEGLEVDVIPGPSALAAALAHLPVQPQRFTFMAFPGKKRAQLRKFAKEIAGMGHPAVVFVGPHDLAKLTDAAIETLPAETRVLFCREMTKLFQEVRFIGLGELKERAAKEVRGEITLIFVPPEAEPHTAGDAEPHVGLSNAADSLAKLGLSGRDRIRTLNSLFPGQKDAVRRAVYNTGAEPPGGEGD